MSPDRNVVHKFGGAALADGASIRAAIELVRTWGGERPIVVVSALAGVTRTLGTLVEDAAARRPVPGGRLQPIRVRHRSVLRELDLDGELCDRTFAELARVLEAIEERGQAGPRERDFVLASGERLSARIVASALRGAGVPSTAIDAFDLGLLTDSRHGGARPDLSSLDALARALGATPGLPVVTGFVAADESGHLTTLGPNGTDLSATLCGRAVGAAEVVLWKLVPGLMTADPAVVATARRIERLSFEAAGALARHGASVLHPETVEPLIGRGIPLRLKDVRAPGEAGTTITDEPAADGPVGLASRVGRLDEGGSFVADEAGPLACLALVGAGELDARGPLERIGLDPVRTLSDRGCPCVLLAPGDLGRAMRALHQAWFEHDLTTGSNPR